MAAATTTARYAGTTGEKVNKPVDATTPVAGGADTFVERLSALYYQAGDLAIEMESAARADPYGVPTDAQVAGYNRILQEARGMISGSIALREDVAEVTPDEDEGGQWTTDALYRALHTTIVPTLHNALTDLRPESV